jgi:hypothetical protein
MRDDGDRTAEAGSISERLRFALEEIRYVPHSE